MRRSVTIGAAALALLLIAGAIWLALGQPSGESKTFTPVGAIRAELYGTRKQALRARYCRHHPRGCITRHHKRYASPRQAQMMVTEHGRCFGMDGRSILGNRLIRDVDHGQATFRGCTRDGFHINAPSFFTDHHESWLWMYDGVSVLDNRTFFCVECMSYAHIWRLQFSWHKGISVFGQELFWHKTTTLSCTLYATTYPYGRWRCS